MRGLMEKINLVLYVLPSWMTFSPVVYDSNHPSMSETISSPANSVWGQDEHLSVYTLLFMFFPILSTH